MLQTSLKFLSFPLLSIILFFSCSDEKIIEEEKFIEVYIDLLIMQDTTSANQNSIDSIKSIVFQKHSITAKDYEQTIEQYNSSPEKWEEFFTKATAYVEKLKQEAEN
jgi:formate-dependent nitrite reductase cytochrome c552 subunit